MARTKQRRTRKTMTTKMQQTLIGKPKDWLPSDMDTLGRRTRKGKGSRSRGRTSFKNMSPKSKNKRQSSTTKYLKSLMKIPGKKTRQIKGKKITKSVIPVLAGEIAGTTASGLTTYATGVAPVGEFVGKTANAGVKSGVEQLV